MNNPFFFPQNKIPFVPLDLFQFYLCLQQYSLPQGFASSLSDQRLILNQYPSQQLLLQTTSCHYHSQDRLKVEPSEFEKLHQLKIEKAEIKEEEENQHLQKLITRIVKFFTQNYKKLGGNDVNQEKDKYFSHPQLIVLFDALIEFYKSAGKSREEMKKFVYRTVKAKLKDSLTTADDPIAKAASLGLSKNYSKNCLQDLVKNKHQSKFTKMLQEPQFYYFRQQYLQNLDRVFQGINQEKINELVLYFEKCIKAKKAPDLQKLKRLPWLEEWLDSTKQIAHELFGESS